MRWEAHHLARSAQCGAILIWYAEQGEEVPRRSSPYVRPYAKTTNKESFEWQVNRRTHPEIKLCLGAHPDTSSLGYEEARIGWDLPELPPRQTDLEELCKMAVDLAHESQPIENFAFWTPGNPYLNEPR